MKTNVVFHEEVSPKGDTFSVFMCAITTDSLH